MTRRLVHATVYRTRARSSGHNGALTQGPVGANAPVTQAGCAHTRSVGCPGFLGTTCELHGPQGREQRRCHLDWAGWDRHDSGNDDAASPDERGTIIAVTQT